MFVCNRKDYTRPIFFTTYLQWSYWKQKLFDYLPCIHLADTLDFGVALLCWFWIFPMTFPEAHEWHFKWVSIVFCYNIACEFIIYSFWHWLGYSRTSPYVQGPLHEKKFNPINPYDDNSQQHLLREVVFTTLGWLQSAFIQCIFMWLWASGRLPYYQDFWSRPLFSIFMLFNVILWRSLHFYWVSQTINILYFQKSTELF